MSTPKPVFRLTDLRAGVGGRETLRAISDEIARFVSANSEQCKVGQTFVAALFDLIFPAETVRMGNNNGPSAGLPGDVQVAHHGHYWLSAEVKQKPVVTSEIQVFIDRVKAVGGDRAWYFALGNAQYPQNIYHAQLQRRAALDGMELMVYSSPKEALRDLLLAAPGSAEMVAEQLVKGVFSRLDEAQVSTALEARWLKSLGSLHRARHGSRH